MRKRQFPVIGGGGGVRSYVHIDDAAAATVAGVERGQPGIYNVVDGEPAPVPEWLPVLASALGAKSPRRIPGWLARLLAGETATAMATRTKGASNEKAKPEFGWQPRYASWRQGFAQGLGWSDDVGRSSKSSEGRRLRLPTGWAGENPAAALIESPNHALGAAGVWSARLNGGLHQRCRFGGGHFALGCSDSIALGPQAKQDQPNAVRLASLELERSGIHATSTSVSGRHNYRPSRIRQEGVWRPVAAGPGGAVRCGRWRPVRG